MPPTSVQIFDGRAATSLYYAPEMRYVNEDIGQRDWVSETASQGTGYASGPPDASLDSLVPFGPSPNVFSAVENGTVRESTFMGRPSLTVTAPVQPAPIVVHNDAEHPDRSYVFISGPTVDEVELTVDKVSHLPVRVASYLRGQAVGVQTLVDIRINESVSPAEFEYTIRKGAKVERPDYGFRDAELDDVEKSMGYVPLVPARLPVGFALQEVRCARRTTTDVWTLHLNDARSVRHVVTRRITSIGYGKGFLHLTVSLRPARGLDPRWLAEPFKVDPSLAGATAPPERVTITSGALAGAEAFVSLPPLDVPHLWAVHDGLLVTVAGDVTREQLVRIASSLEPASAAQ
jgi:hypothetical protein